MHIVISNTSDLPIYVQIRNNYLRDYEMFTALVERVSEGIFGFSSEDAYQRELNKEKHPSNKRKKFGHR